MKLISLLLALLLLCAPCALGETLSLDEMLAAEDAATFESAIPANESAARADFIDRIIATAKQLYDAAGGRAKRAQYSGDIYVCKNFTTYLFSADDFNSATRRIAAIRLVNDARERKVREIDSLTIQLDSARKVLDAEKITLQDTRNRHNSELKKLSANERDYKKRLSTLSSREKKVLKAQ
jgi:septal ring factor EnvC (AmiA/AmiB activator)